MSDTKRFSIPQMVHDLLNPVATVQANLGFLRRSVDGELKEAVVEALAEARRAERMLRDLQDLDRVDQGLLKLERSRSSLSQLARIAAGQLEDAARLRGSPIEVTGDAPAEVDPVLMRRVIINLVSVALRYGAPGEPVRVIIDQVEGRARVTVLDKGAKIPEAERRAISTGASDDAALALVRPAAALSYAFVRAIVKAHGGRLMIEDHPDGSASIVVV